MTHAFVFIWFSGTIWKCSLAFGGNSTHALVHLCLSPSLPLPSNTTPPPAAALPAHSALSHIPQALFESSSNVPCERRRNWIRRCCSLCKQILWSCGQTNSKLSRGMILFLYVEWQWSTLIPPLADGYHSVQTSMCVHFVFIRFLVDCTISSPYLAYFGIHSPSTDLNSSFKYNSTGSMLVDFTVKLEIIQS